MGGEGALVSQLISLSESWNSAEICWSVAEQELWARLRSLRAFGLKVEPCLTNYFSEVNAESLRNMMSALKARQINNKIWGWYSKTSKPQSTPKDDAHLLPSSTYEEDEAKESSKSD